MSESVTYGRRGGSSYTVTVKCTRSSIGRCVASYGLSSSSPPWDAFKIGCMGTPNHRDAVLTPVIMSINGVETSTRQEWADHLGQYLATKHADPNNTMAIQTARLSQFLPQLPDQPYAVQWHHLLHSLGCARSGRASGKDEHSPDLLSALPGRVREQVLVALYRAAQWPGVVLVPEVWRIVLMFWVS